MPKSSLEDKLEKVKDQIDDIDLNDVLDAQSKLERLQEELTKLQEQARCIEDDKDVAEEDATAHERRTGELAEEIEELERRYQFAIRLLELGYGISEHDLDLASGSTPEDAYRKLVRVTKQAIERGSLDAHRGCDYTGTCIAYAAGLADEPCAAGRKPLHKGRFSTSKKTGATTVNPVLHGSCSSGYCVPVQLGWIAQSEGCQ